MRLSLEQIAKGWGRCFIKMAAPAAATKATAAPAPAKEEPVAAQPQAGTEPAGQAQPQQAAAQGGQATQQSAGTTKNPDGTQSVQAAPQAKAQAQAPAAPQQAKAQQPDLSKMTYAQQTKYYQGQAAQLRQQRTDRRSMQQAQRLYQREQWRNSPEMQALEDRYHELERRGGQEYKDFLNSPDYKVLLASRGISSSGPLPTYYDHRMQIAGVPQQVLDKYTSSLRANPASEAAQRDAGGFYLPVARDKTFGGGAGTLVAQNRAAAASPTGSAAAPVSLRPTPGGSQLTLSGGQFNLGGGIPSVNQTLNLGGTPSMFANYDASLLMNKMR